MNENDLEDIELDLLLEGVKRWRGYDFTNYARASLRRRVAALMSKEGIAHVAEAISPLLRNDAVFNQFLKEMSVTVTEMFRDPEFYATFRKKVLPLLRSYPLLKIWHAGCATGEEVYSMAMLLDEEGIYERSRIYATDFNNESLDTAAAGIYPTERMKGFLENHNRSEPKGSFSDYIHASYSVAKMADKLKRNITFANHNLVTDHVFGEMNVVICRNVLIYFNKDLQDRVLGLFRDSLCHRGFLCLGSKESLRFSAVAQDFEDVSQEHRIFRKRSLPLPVYGVGPGSHV